MKLYGIPCVTGSSLGSEIWIKEIKGHYISVTSSGIRFGPLYPMLQQLSLGVLFGDEFWKRMEP